MISAKQYGPWAVITGGSEGIGASFARKLALAGINVVLIARRPGPLEELAGKIRAEAGVQIRTLSLDLSGSDTLSAVRKVTDDIEVGMLVHNAADTGHISPFLDQTLDQALGSVRLIALGLTALAHHFGAKMAKRGRGGMILLGSLTGNVGMANVATYGASKAFTQIFGESLWAELKPHGIDVLVVMVGSTDTPARARSGATNMSSSPLTPPDEVAQLALDNLADGPVFVMPLVVPVFQRLCSPERRQLTETTGTSARRAAKQG